MNKLFQVMRLRMVALVLFGMFQIYSDVQGASTSVVDQLEAIGKTSTVTFSDGQVLNFLQLDSMEESKLEALQKLVLKESEWIKFREWQLRLSQVEVELDKKLAEAKAREAEQDKKLAEAKARVAEQDKKLAEAKARVAEKAKQLAQKYELYISNIERGARGHRATLMEAINNEQVPESVKNRARALLADAKVQWTSD